jgi:hypothetical protein
MSGQFPPEILTRWWNASNAPLFGGSVGWYKAGLDPIAANRKDVYLTTDALTPIANPVPFDVEGKAQIVLGSGSYKRVIWSGLDESSTALWTTDNINFAGGSFSSSGAVPTMAALKAIPSASAPILGAVFMEGYNAAGDGGGGWFYWNTSSVVADDTGYTISPNDAPTIGRWIRIPDESGDVRATAFGYTPNIAGSYITQLQNADIYCLSNDKRLLIGPGSIGTIGNNAGSPYLLYAPKIKFEQGAVLTGGDTAVTVQTLGIISGPPEKIFSNITHQVNNVNQIMDRPEWYGASQNSADNTAALAAWIAAGTAFPDPSRTPFILPPDVWNYADPTTFPWPANSPVILFGRLHGTSVDYPTGVYYPNDSIFRMHEILLDNGTNLKSYSTTGVIASGVLRAASSIQGLANISSVTGIAAGTTSTAVGDTIAGQGAGNAGLAKSRAGTGTKQFAAAGRLISDFTTYAGASSTGAHNLAVSTIPANTLNIAATSLSFMASGAYHSTGGSAITISLAINTNSTTPGTTQIANFVLGSLTNDKNYIWDLKLEYVYLSATTIKVFAFLNLYNITDSTSLAVQTVQTASVTTYNTEAVTVSYVATLGAGIGSGGFTQLMNIVNINPAGF